MFCFFVFFGGEGCSSVHLDRGLIKKRDDKSSINQDRERTLYCYLTQELKSTTSFVDAQQIKVCARLCN